MTRDMTITIQCDGKNCNAELKLDLADGAWDLTADMKIEKALERAGWYENYDGDFCQKCAEQAKKDWARQP